MNSRFKSSTFALLLVLIVMMGDGVLGAKNVNELVIIITNAGDADGTYTLSCDPVSGNHPRAVQACSQLNAATAQGADPFAAPSPSQMCTMQYGGPQVATVTGTWGGKQINATFKRTNGCEISRWNKLSDLLLS